MIEIASRRELFFDDYLLDTEKTTAQKRLHHPVRKDIVLEMDQPWEGDSCGYFSVFFAEGKWHMYYRCSGNGRGSVGAAYAESEDGLHWVRPSLGLVEYNDSRDNNLIFGREFLQKHGFRGFDNFYVFYDTNPACPAEEKYKMLAMHCGNGALIGFASPDGIHWDGEHFLITKDGEFDSHNLAFWDPVKKKYFCYYRGEHRPEEESALVNKSFTDAQAKMLFDPLKGAYKEAAAEAAGAVPFTRDVRVIESEDFKTWTPQQLIRFSGEDCQMYTNGVMPYPRAPHIMISILTRYVERKRWTPNYDELCGRERRRGKMERYSFRAGTAITDTVFMASRDGHFFTKYDEAFITPPPENPDGWVYGDGYSPTVLIESPSDIPGAEPEYSVFVIESYMNTQKDHLTRYTFRKDGFVSLHGGGTPEKIVTRPFTYTGEALYVNIATSARGGAYFRLRGENGEEAVSYEVFGDSTDKRVHFEDEEIVKRLAGKAVTLEIEILDGELYALRFAQNGK